MKPQLQRRSGFTLIEIMIVIGIIAVVMAMGIPSVVQMTKKDPLRKAVSDVMEACSHARARAILNSATTELSLRAADGLITVRQVPAKPIGKDGQTGESSVPAGNSAPPGTSVFSAQLHEDVGILLLEVNLKNQMESEEARVRFHPEGTSEEFTVVFEYRGETRKISLECVTGLADLTVIK